ncbi:MAG TPA: hypothetical protein IAA08_08490 [Candidatus Eubacterium avistercoris]|uniref:Integrase SAM-like N-terminal domain-containing protein n=2 Tax=Clostridia TaxID=186801 RepID=A0A9D2D3N9_9FIRM|nr:hypothetical protein [Candidatus Copromonas faecavium]HIZ07958.1 hypothetical protein [Candidatus Eubacterium avistercoris]
MYKRQQADKKRGIRKITPSSAYKRISIAFGRKQKHRLRKHTPTQKQYVIDKELLPFFEKIPLSQIEPAEKRFSKRYGTFKGTLSGNFSHRPMCENDKTASYLTGTKTASPILKLTLEPKPTSYPLL